MSAGSTIETKLLHMDVCDVRTPFTLVILPPPPLRRAERPLTKMANNKASHATAAHPFPLSLLGRHTRGSTSRV